METPNLAQSRPNFLDAGNRSGGLHGLPVFLNLCGYVHFYRQDVFDGNGQSRAASFPLALPRRRYFPGRSVVCHRAMLLSSRHRYNSADVESNA